MADQLAEIVVRFKSIPHSIFNQPISSFQPNSLVIRLQPDEGLNLNLMAKTPGDGMRLKLVDLELDFRETFKKPRMEAYERLLMDVLRYGPDAEVVEPASLRGEMRILGSCFCCHVDDCMARSSRSSSSARRDGGTVPVSRSIVTP